MALAAGDHLGRYEVLAPLGAGGMGEVYRARDTALDREVAVKVLPEGRNSDPERLRLFERETRAVARLAHPNILEIWDVGTDGGVSFAVMECLEGETLRERFQRGPLEWRKVAELGAAIADGLAAAHAAGIVHRDLKPSNVFLTADGRVKILDFGLASMGTHAGADADSTAPGSTLTERGTMVGTVGYMSPEQVRGDPADHRSDMFSLGCVLYEAVSGRRAFERETAVEAMTAILREEPERLARTGAVLPLQLARTIERCLEKRPDVRYQSAADLAHTLREIESADRPSMARTSRWLRMGAWLVLGAAAVVAAALVLSNLSIRPAAEPRAVRRYSIVLPDDAPLQPSQLVGADPPLPAPPLAVSPNGDWLVYASGERYPTRLMRRRLDRIEVEAIEGATNGVTNPFFSPDGRWVGFSRFGNGPVRVPLTGGFRTLMREPTELWLLLGAWWQDDGYIVFGGIYPPGIYRVPEDGGRSEPVLLADRAVGERSLEFPETLPGGRGMLMTVWQVTADGSESYLAAQSLPSGRRTVLAQDAAFGRYAASGHVVYPSGGRLMALPFDPRTLEPTGPPVDVSEPGMGDGGPPYEWTFSRQGTLVYAPISKAQRSRQTIRIVWEGGEEEPVWHPENFRRDWLRVSPDGKRFAFGLLEMRSRRKNVVTNELGRDADFRVTFDPDVDEYPIWTPDGERLVFTSRRDGKADLYWKRTDSDEPAERLTDMDPTLPPFAYSWSPDGTTLFFWDWGPPDLGCDLWTLSLAEQPPRVERLKSADVCLSHPAISPDGRWLAFSQDSDLRLAPYPAMDRLLAFSGVPGAYPVWHPDGSSIFFLDLFGNLMEVEVRTEPTISFSKPREVLEGPFDSLDITPDGERFLVLKVEPGEPITELVVVENWFEELRRKAPPSR